MKIIIADTSLSARSRMTNAIQERHWSSEILPCADVEETIEMCASFRPDAVFMSTNLLGGNPMDILPAIKRANLDPLIVVLVDPAFPMVKQQFLHAGAHRVVDDPADFTTALNQYACESISPD